ncbi:hypothetical protein [Enterococcus xiangfangensis]|uniref:hypothetical protein n=1 Tax=Enterococcus xiangfangensis TaxID=1296537 RepID=UPI003D175DAB|nr:hypothetical protein [Enterococcus asini]
MKIPYLLAFPDISSQKKKTLEDMCDDLGVSRKSKSEELANAIWQELTNSDNQKEKLEKYSNLLLSTRGSVTWFETLDQTSLSGLKELLISDEYNPFEKRKEFSNTELNSTPKLFAASEISEDEYLLRFVFRSGSMPIYSMNGKEDIPRLTFATVYINEKENVMEVRASQTVTHKVAQEITKYLIDGGKEVKISKKDILDEYSDIGNFANALGGKFKEAIDVPEQGTDEMTDVQISAIASILKSIDKALYDDEYEDLQTALVEAQSSLIEEYPNFSFLGLVLTGLGKVNLGSSIKDLRESPLYESLSPYLNTKSGYIDYTIPVNGVETEGSIQVGLATKTINFSKNTTEEMISFVRNKVYNI